MSDIKIVTYSSSVVFDKEVNKLLAEGYELHSSASGVMGADNSEDWYQAILIKRDGAEERRKVATMAMQGLLANPNVQNVLKEGNYTDIIFMHDILVRARQYADALIAVLDFVNCKEPK